MGATGGAGNVYPYGAPVFNPGLHCVPVAQSLVFCVVFCRSFFVLLYFFFWPLFCLSFDFSDSDYLPLVSSNSSYKCDLCILHYKL